MIQKSGYFKYFFHSAVVYIEMEASPSQTLYINNINEKVKIDVLKKMFYMVFSQYGKVTAIVSKKGMELRGQAWVTFQDVAAASNALRGKQGFNFYGKPLVRITIIILIQFID